MTTRLRHLLSAYRWPLLLGGLLAMSIVAHGILVFVATRPDTPPPIADYYQRALRWDADAAVLAHSRQLGWQVQIEVPTGPPYTGSALRPVDVTVADPAGQPVHGLQGRLVAVRPADARLSGEAALTELPHAPGRYRALARLPAPGLWELNLDAQLGALRFVHQARVDVDGEGAR